MKLLRILVVDDHDVVRRGICSLLKSKPDCQICGEAANGFDAVAMAERLKPDVVVLDISLPDMDGLKVTRHIRQSVPAARVLILSMHDSEQMVEEAYQLGARGYITKSEAASELSAALDAFRRNELYFPPRMTPHS